MANQVSRLSHTNGFDNENPYDVLEVRKWATLEDIKKSYFNLVKKNSPEFNPKGFMRIRKAYDRVRSNDRRAREDILLFNELPGGIGYRGIPKQKESIVKLNRLIKEYETKASRGPLSQDDKKDLAVLLRRRSLAYFSTDLVREAMKEWEHLEKEFGCKESRRNRFLALGKIGHRHAQDEQFDEARKAWQKALELDSENSLLIHNLAILATRTREPEEEQTWRRLLRVWHKRLDQEDDEYTKNLIVETHKYFGGRFIDEGSAEKTPPRTKDGAAPEEPKEPAPRQDLPMTSYESMRDIGQACMEQKNWPQAIAAFEKCMQERRDDLVVLNDLAWAYLNTGNINRAMSMWNRAFKMEPENRRIRDSLVRANLSVGGNLVKSGMVNQAFVHLKKAQQLAPESNDVNEALADAYFSRQEYQTAIQHWEKVLRTTRKRKEIQDKIRDARARARTR